MGRLWSLILATSMITWGQSVTPSIPAAVANAGDSSKAAEKTATTPPVAPTPLPGDSTKVELVKATRAVYPLDAQSQGIQGQVVVKILISETGDVKSAEVLSGDPLLRKSAIDAAKKWKFKPYITNGKPVKVMAQLPFDFYFGNKLMEKGVSADRSTSNDKHLPEPARLAVGPSDSGPPPNGSTPTQQVKRVQIMPGLIQGMLVHQVAPVYPQEARRNHVQGTVILRAVISKDGRIVDLKPVSGPKDLIPAAIGGVQQWRYRPYLLAGEPVEVETLITVNFQLW
jgi:TonB family protein